MKALMTRTMLAASFAAALGAGPASADDLMFRYQPMKHINVLKAYGGTPYWGVLAECAGVYGALVNRYETTGQGALAGAAKAEGVRFLNTATARLQMDRGLAPGEALELTKERVEIGRQSGQQMLSEPPARGLRHEQVIEMFCSQVDQAHRSAARFARR